MSEPSPTGAHDLGARAHQTTVAAALLLAALLLAAVSPAQFAMSISLSMPPLLLPRSTEASWFGASSLDEDAALAKMEEALQQQLLGIKNFNSDIPIVGRGREAAGGAVPTNDDDVPNEDDDDVDDEDGEEEMDEDELDDDGGNTTEVEDDD